MTSAAFPVCLILTLVLSVGACTDPDDGRVAKGPGDPIRRGNVENPGTLDPALAEDVHAFNVLIDLYEGLVAEDARGKLVPGVAESWTISGDGLIYTFTLRATARWSNGDRVVARDFANGFRRAASPKTMSGYSFLLEPIENLKNVNNGTMTDDELGVSAIGESTLIIRLSKPSAHFLSVLSMPIAFPLHGNGTNRAQFHDPASFVGNGAYILARHELGGPILVRRNAHYWDIQSVNIAEVEYIAVADEVAELNMYRAGELDITATIPPSHIDIVKRDNPNETRIAPSLALYYLAFDLTESPLNSRHLRQALSMAIDREQLVGLLGRGEQPAYGIVPPGVANYQGARYQWQNVEREDRHRRALGSFRLAGYGPDRPLRLKFVYDVGRTHEQVALAVSEMWRDVLGVETELEKREWKYFLDTRENREDWQVMRFSWFGDYNDPATFTDIFRSTSAQNLPHFTDPEYDKLIDEAQFDMNVENRAAKLSQAEALLLNAYPIAPLYFYASKHMVKPYVLGFENNVLDRHPSKYLAFSQGDAVQN